MHGEHHFIGLGRIIQGFCLVAEPQQLLLAVALADVDTELHEGIIDNRLESVGRLGIGGTFDGDRPLVVGIRGGTPRTVLFLDVEGNRAVQCNAVVGRNVPRAGENVSEPGSRHLCGQCNVFSVRNVC